MKAIKCTNVCKSYGSGNAQVHALKNASAIFNVGTFYSLIGRSGSGKSTLLHVLSCMIKPDSGNIKYDEMSITNLGKRDLEKVRRENVGFIFQDYQLLPELTVKENIILPLILSDRHIDSDWCSTILEALSIEDISNKHPHELSGGQQQRVAIGRALIHRPSFIFADEPTGNLDKKTSQAVLDLLLNVRSLFDPMILLATHDLDIARSADVVLHIEDGDLFTP